MGGKKTYYGVKVEISPKDKERLQIARVIYCRNHRLAEDTQFSEGFIINRILNYFINDDSENDA